MVTAGGQRIGLDVVYVEQHDGLHVWRVAQTVPKGARLGVDVLPAHTKLAASFAASPSWLWPSTS